MNDNAKRIRADLEAAYGVPGDAGAEIVAAIKMRRDEAWLIQSHTGQCGDIGRWAGMDEMATLAEEILARHSSGKRRAG